MKARADRLTKTAKKAAGCFCWNSRLVRLAGEAVDLTFRTSGTSGAKTNSALGNAMLSLTVIRTHMGLQWDRTMENVGRLRMGLTPGFL